jgi:predicted O-methyltransferase YrrM
MRFSERIFRRFVYKYYARNLLVDLQILAKRESVDYVRAHMRDATIFHARGDLLTHGLALAPSTGSVLEFGVGKGVSINVLARATARPVHGFDSFDGLPENWTGTAERRGKFSTGGKLPKVPPNVTLHRGLFDATLAEFLGHGTEPIAFLHVDCDLYSSTKAIFERVAARLMPGTIIVFDEYFNYPNWQQHEYKAFQEFVARHQIRYRYFGFSASGGQVGVMIESIGLPG